MRKYLLAATAAAAMAASPAAARDNSWYAGIEGGVLLIEDLALDYEDATTEVDRAFTIDHNMGFDVDLIGGYDMGMLRIEAETAYKRASLDEVTTATEFVIPGDPPAFEADGSARALSAMVNVLVDFGDDMGWNGFIGGGVGLARIKYNADFGETGLGFRDEDDTFAWQLLAGVRAALSPTMDVGLKYRFFNANNLRFGNDDGPVPFNADGRWRSHSLLASLIFNFAPPPPPPVILPPPPPPPPPATQVCPDGSVILATDVCPAPPPPPPPPPPAGERG